MTEPRGVHERAPRVRVAERVQALGQPAHVGVRPQAEAPEQLAGGAPGRARDATEQQRQHELGARQRGGPQREADLLAQAAAVDEHEPLQALGELVGELHRDAAAERMADDGRRRDPEHRQEVAHPAGVGAERVVAARLARAAVAEQVGGDDGVVLGETVA